jgi:glucosamine-6-phosphate deaminase
LTRVVVAGRLEVARRAARRIAAVLRRDREPVLLLASGKTMVPVYRELASISGRGRAPFRRARTFNLDELAVAAGDPRSFRSFMERELFSKIPLRPDRIHFLRGDAADVERECRRYERELARFGPPDLALLGIGANGHVAYLEPGRSLPPVTSPVRLSASTRRGLAQDGIRPAPRSALTMGLETILKAKELLLVATGRDKADAVAGALSGRITPQCPASFLTLHPKLTVLLDRGAESKVRPG